MDKKNHSNMNKNYARAPYNFIPFPHKIFYRHTVLKEYENEGITMLSHHDEFKKDLKTGYIDYSIYVETPLFISNGDNDFFKINNEYTIPGSSIRGQVRSNAEVLSCSYPDPEFIEDKKLWFRGAFSKDVLKEMYVKELLPNEKSKINDRVKAGYLCREGNKWVVIPAKEDKNHKCFKEIHERNLRDINVYKNIDENIKTKIFMYRYQDKFSKRYLWDLFFEFKNNKKNIAKKIKEKNLSNDEIKILKDKENNKMKRLLETNKIRSFKPYYYKVLYDLKEDNSVKIKRVVESINDNEYGFLMNSSNLDNKQNHYLIFKKDNDKGKKYISQELINQYKTSVKYRQNEEVENFKIDDEYKVINGKEKPIFYILDEKQNIISFGFTPYLKIPYKNTVVDGIKTKSENGKLDYAKSIFGFTNFKYKEQGKVKNLSYKGHVSFTNAKLNKECTQVKEPILKHLMNPKISSFQLYLKQDSNDPKKLKTYSSDDFELRGQKFYWLRDKHNDVDEYKKELQKYEKQKENQKYSNKKPPNKEQFATLSPVNEGSIFKGRVYFENLYEDELGLLLMSIKPFENAKENLGQGKPYGYGRVSFKIEDIVEINSQNRFTSLNIDICKELINKDKYYYIEKFKNYMKKQNINVDFNNESMYRCFYESKSQIKDINIDEFNYMEITEFRNRNILKTVEEYAEERKVKNIKEYVAVTEEPSFEDITKKLANKFSVKTDNRKNRKY
ncbi:TIGR03986 family CRISPR-associated RAMP protein [Clostridium botulinum]|nr:TIGR03986 family CRISPR-associated RAMP protein [Clostridium botulinum]NFS96928.1 TIGR03986 family CRISPR-associated RAMP protein [Clostridium botulinum]